MATETVRNIAKTIATKSDHLEETYKACTLKKYNNSDMMPLEQIIFKDLIILFTMHNGAKIKNYFCFPEGQFNLEEYERWRFLTLNANQDI